MDSLHNISSLPGPPPTSLLRTRSLGRKRVTFDTTEIRKFGIMMDSSRKGEVALTMSWKHHDTEVTTVQDFDMERSSQGPGSVRLLDERERAALLKRCGYSRNDIYRNLAGLECKHDKCCKGGVNSTKEGKDKKMFSHLKRTVKKISRSVTI